MVVDNGESETFGDNITVQNGDALTVKNYASAEVKGNVTTEGGASAVEAYNGSVTVEGNVTAGDGGCGVGASGESSVLVEGNAVSGPQGYGVGVHAINDSVIVVMGDAVAGGNAVYANMNGRVLVEGDAISTSDGGGEGVLLCGDANIYIGGDTEGYDGVRTSLVNGGAAVVIMGEASGIRADLNIWADPDACPDFVVGSLANAEINVYSRMGAELSDPADVEKIIQSVLYIISTGDGVTVTSGGRTYDNGGLDISDMDVAAEDDILVVSVAGAQKKGYVLKLNAGKYAGVVDNGDGTFNVTVNRGGDLNLEMFYERIGSFGGSKLRIGGCAFIILGFDEEGNLILGTVAELTEEEMADLEGTLKELLSEKLLESVLPGEDGSLCSLVSQELADKYFNGNVNHLCFRLSAGAF